MQNAHDSCLRRRIESEAGFEPRIEVSADPQEGLLVIEDTGAGLTKEEIEQYLANVGAGYTRKLKAEHRDAGLIGQFGVGFLTAFYVGRQVEVVTTSHTNPGEGWRFSSRNGHQYTLEAVEPRPVGTRLVLKVQDQFRELVERVAAGYVLDHYCSLLHVPVYSGPDRIHINETVPPWRLDSEVSDVRRQRLAFDFAARFERTFKPLCTFDVSGPDELHLDGLLWIQDGATYATSDNRNVSVYIHGMLVTRDARELFPPWAGFVGGVLESRDLKPTASRESLQEDETFERVQELVREALINGMRELSTRSPEVWRAVLRRHNEALLGAALADDRLFDILGQVLKVPTSEGDLTLPVVADRSDQRVYVTLGDHPGAEETLFRALGVPIVTGHRYAAAPFASRYAQERALSVIELGTEEGNRTLLEPVDASAEVKARLTTLLLSDGDALYLSRFKPAALPLLAIVNREAELKRRLESEQTARRISSAALGLARKFTRTLDGTVERRVYVNLDAPLIQALLAADDDRQRVLAAGLKGLSRLLGRQDLDTDVSKALEEINEALLGLMKG